MIEAGAMFCPSCPALLILVRVDDGPLHAHTADQAGAAGERHVCRGQS